MMENKDILMYNSNSNGAKNFNNLYSMMNEYNCLNNEDKSRYMNILTSWYMREKDLLNIKNNKSP
jgi:hypothetical protein